MARAPFSAGDRQRLLAAYEKSGLTQEQFCARHDLVPRTFRSWTRAARQDLPRVDAEVVRKAIALLRQAAQVLEAAVGDHPTDLVELQAAAASEQVATIRDGDALSPTVRALMPLDCGSQTTEAAATDAPQRVARFSFDEEFRKANTGP